MAVIVTNPNWLIVDGGRIQKGSKDLYLIPDGVSLRVAGTSSKIDILVEGTTIDGTPVADRDALMAFFESQGFRQGGTGPSDGVQSVSGDGVNNTDPKNPKIKFPEPGDIGAASEQDLDSRIPSLGVGEFLIGSADGNIGAIPDPKLLGFNPNNIGTGTTRFVAFDATTNKFRDPISGTNTANNSTLVIRTPTGQGKFQPAVNADEAVVLSQLEAHIPTITEVLGKDNYADRAVTFFGHKGYTSGREGLTIYTVSGTSNLENSVNGSVASGISVYHSGILLYLGSDAAVPETAFYLESGVSEITTRLKGKDAESEKEFVTLKQLKAYTLEDSTNAGNHTQVGIGVTGSEGDPPTDGAYITHNSAGVSTVGHYRGGALEASINITSENSEVASGIEFMAGGKAFTLRDIAKFSTRVQGEDAVEENEFVTKGQVNSVISQVVIDDTSTEALTKEELNTTYPDLNIGSQVYVPLIETMYTKVSAEDWASVSFVLL